MNATSIELELYNSARKVMPTEADDMGKIFAQSLGMDRIIDIESDAFQHHMAAIYLQLQASAVMHIVGGVNTIKEDIVGLVRIHVPIEAALAGCAAGQTIRELKERYNQAFGSSRTDGYSPMADALFESFRVKERRNEWRTRVSEHWSTVWAGYFNVMAAKPAMFMCIDEASKTDIEWDHYGEALQSAIRASSESLAMFMKGQLSVIDQDMATAVATVVMSTLTGAGQACPPQPGMDEDALFQMVMLYAAKHPDMCPLLSHLYDMLQLYRCGVGSDRDGANIQRLVFYCKRYELYVPDDKRPMGKYWLATRKNPGRLYKY